KHLFVIAPCGAGKTLSFMAPLLFNPLSIIFIVCPLLSLASQHCKSLVAFGIRAIELTMDNMSAAVLKEIADGDYQAVLGPPEILNSDRRIRRLFKDQGFSERFSRYIFDEAHCVLDWNSFRPEYQNFDLMRSVLPSHARIFCCSATVTNDQRKQIMAHFEMRDDQTELVRLKNDLPNVFYAARPMPGAADCYSALLPLLPDNPELLAPDCPAPPKFMVFTQSKAECVNACLYLMNALPANHCHKVAWFFSDMSEEFKEEKLRQLREGIIWGLFCTDAAGMGIDLATIQIVIQWGIKHLLFNMLYQRFGRCGRD
ncbi:P-loop containing nucleoside triphosphate hydrolase protein, partial [Auricularia subglabra TFB-10046 SS5]